MSKKIEQVVGKKADKPFLLADDELKFIEDYATIIMARGMPYSSGCVLALMLLWQKAVTIDEVARALGFSRTGAWNAARKLENHGHVIRHGRAGSKVALYSPSDNFGTPIMGQMVILGELTELMEECAKTTAKGSAVDRLTKRALYFDELRRAVVDKIKELDVKYSDNEERPD